MADSPPSLSWVHAITTRDGTLTKDSKMVNCFIEQTENGPAIVKRPGSSYVSTRTGIPQGQFFPYEGVSPSLFGYYIVNDTIYQYEQPTFSLEIPNGTLGFPYNIVTGPSLSPGTYSVYAIIQSSGPRTAGPPGPGGGLWVFNGATLTPAGSGYPSGSALPGVAVLDGITYVMTAVGNIQGSAINDPTTWPALDFIGPTGAVGVGAGVWRHLNYIVAYYTQGIQVYYDANAAPNGQGIALGPVTNAAWSTGCLSYYSLAEINDTTFFVAQDNVFGRTVQAMSGITLNRVSTPFVEKILARVPVTNAAGSILNIWSFAMRIAGHSFYVMTLHDIGITLAFDIDQQQWQVWTSVVGGVEQYFIGRYYLNNASGDFLQDLTTGQTMQFSQSVYTDATGPLPVTCVSKNYDWGSLKWKRFAALSQLADTATTVIDVSFSDDDYNTFSTPRTIDLSTHRKQIRNCGSARRRAWKMFHQDNTPLRLWEVELDMIGLSR